MRPSLEWSTFASPKYSPAASPRARQSPRIRQSLPRRSRGGFGRSNRPSSTFRSSVYTVQQLAQVDGEVERAACSGYRRSMALEPDLFIALSRRAESQSSGEKSGIRFASQPSVKYPVERGSTHSMPDAHRSGSQSPADLGHSHPVMSIFNGRSASSGESSYRLLPMNVEETEEVPGDSVSRRKKRLQEKERDLARASMPEWRIRGQQVLEGCGFQTLMAVLIMSNSLVIGLETDITNFEYWDRVENYFLFCFFAELVLKSLFQGPWDMFHKENPDFSWNVFDTLIVTLGVTDFIVGLLHPSDEKSGFATLFRIMRLLRILRIIRIIKFLKQLYLLAVGLAEAAQAVFWVTILMTVILYVCSIIMVKTVGRPPDTDTNQEFLNRHFGGVLPSMFSLFVLMSSPNLPVYQEQVGLLEERPCLAMFLVVFILFGSFGLLALLTGVISESMFEKNNMRKEEEKIEHEKLRLDVGSRCEELYDKFEKNIDDEVYIEDMQEDAAVHEMAKTFESVGVFVTGYDLRTMIEYLDVDGSGTINKNEFIRGMLVLAEGLRPISVQEVHHDVGVCRVKIERIEEILLSRETPRHHHNAGQSTRKSSEGSSSQNILKSLSEHMQDLVQGQKQLSKNFQELDGRLQEISRSPMSDDIASLKAYLSMILQEIGQHVRDQSYNLSRWSDVKFGMPWETRGQARCIPSSAGEPLPSASCDSAWAASPFSAAGSSVEQVGGGAHSAATGVEQGRFSFSPGQFVSPDMQQTEANVIPEVLPTVREPESSRPSTSAEARNMLGASSNKPSSCNERGSLAASQVKELISWQQRIESELQRVSQLAHQESQTTAAQGEGLTHSIHVVPPLPHGAETEQTTEAQEQPPPPSADSSQVAEPARHPSVLESAEQLAELLNQMQRLMSNHEALQRLSVSTNTSRLSRASRSNEVLDCDDAPPRLPRGRTF